MTRLQRAKAPFVQHPQGSLLLAALLAVMALLFTFDVFPPAQKYGPRHGTVAVFFGWCGLEGFRQRARDPQRRRQ